MSIFDVEHQPRAHRVLQRAITSERMPHAYLFAGPEGVGKEMLAVRLARVLLCSQPVERDDVPAEIGIGRAMDACGACDDCRMAGAGTHPDQFVIYRQLNRQHSESKIRKQKALVISVDVIREFLIDRAGVRPMRGRAKVFIVREAERMKEPAQNALLKTLEEPPPATFLILLTTSLDQMLATTRSRCQQVGFQALPTGFIAARLATLKPDVEERERLYVARHGGGSLGAALRQIDDGLFALKRPWGDRLADLVSGRPGVAPNALAKALIDDAKTLGKGVADRDPDVSDTDATRAGMQAMLAVLGDFFLDALRRGAGGSPPPVNADQEEMVKALAAARSVEQLAESLRIIAGTDGDLGSNANVELATEAMFIRLARLGPYRKAG